MACSSKLRDLKYENEQISVKDIIDSENLPIIVRTTSAATQEEHTYDIPVDTDILFQCISKEIYAHIKVLQFYDNAKVQQENGCEYVLEHDTFVGNEYLLPLGFSGKVKFVRRPGSRGRYLTIKQVLTDKPALVKLENETKAFLSSDTEQTTMIQAKTILELIRTYSTDKGVFLECAVGEKKYTFSENDEVNFTVFEKETLYTLAELSDTSFLPRVILFQGVHTDDAVLKDQTLRSAMLTMVEGPIEVLGFEDVEYLIGWIRNKNYKTYETIIVPKNIWNKMFVQKMCFYTDEEKENCIQRKYGGCLKSDFVSKSLYIIPLDQCEVTWLRSPNLFKRHSTGNKLYDVVQIYFEDSSDDNAEEDVSVYAEIEEPPPPIPKRKPIHPTAEITKVKRSTSFLNKVRSLFKSRRKDTVGEESATRNEETPDRPPKPNSHVSAGVQSQHDEIIKPEGKPRGGGYMPIQHLPFISTNVINQNYTKLKFPKTLTLCDTPIIVNSTPYSEPSHDEATETNKRSLALHSNQETFFQYSVEEVSLCLENCGLKHLANTCSEQMLDGSFFDGFKDWSVLNLSCSDLEILKKVIYEGWRSGNDNL